MIFPEKDDKKKLPVAEVKPGPVVGSRVPKDDTVTLTKQQLKALIETFGGRVNNLSLADEPEKQVENGTSDKNSTKESNGSETKSTTNGSLLPMSEMHSSANQNICPLDVLPSDTSKQWSSSCQVMQNSPSKSSNPRLEQKRLQWEKEKAEMIDWNPWGKPGAGAPARRILPIASVAPRTGDQLLMVQTNSVPYSSSVPNGIPSCLTSPSHLKNTLVEQNSQASPFNKTFTTYSCVTQPLKPVPPVFKSSINFGTCEDDINSLETFNKQQWLKDLESQREEQRVRRAVEAEENSPKQDADWLNGNVEEMDSVSMSESTAQCQPDGRSYVRGQGFKLDPESAARADERRQKAQQYQEAIKKQMEEKQRRREEEKERKRKEEEEEERRLIAERARLQQEYEQEQHRIKQKKELEEQKQAALISAVRKAEEEAQASRRSRKSHKSSPRIDEGPSQSPYCSPKKGPSEDVSPRIQYKGEDKSGQEARTSQQTATVRPFQNSNMDSQQNVAKTERSPKKELGVQTVSLPSTEVEEYSGYVVNRVLTPSPYRIKSRRGRAKDFGTQTDNNYGKWLGDDAESTDQSNTSSIHPSVNKRFTRVQHAKPYKALRRDFCTTDSLTDRPKWGQNQPSKSYIRMTDRDPYFSKRRKLQEERKQKWQQEMANQQALKNSRRAIPPYRNHARARSSSDGTAGFSSSEASNVRSHSPQHHQPYGFRSVCGSAEDVAYLAPSSAYSSTMLPSVQDHHRRRPSHSSDNLPSIIMCGSEPTPSRLTERFSFPEVSPLSGDTLDMPMRRKWHSQEAFYPHVAAQQQARRSNSPPVPAVQKRLLSESKSSLTSPATHSRRKWSDQESFDLESVAMSHVQSHQSSSEDSSEKNDRDTLSSADSTTKPKLDGNHNPLVCPEVVTRRPTPRQDRILQNLSSLRQGLLQKQKELETLIRHPPHIS